ncbi:d-isomer specific 2-hydroxyacid dehydrogenase, NAD binding domain-containing protein [Ditylenchus destructor]|nr:d-isomer specific 2-hydroxyacid dehydrogenase, NAD binding domain-containing protein [Ditylenchus destructor]
MSGTSHSSLCRMPSSNPKPKILVTDSAVWVPKLYQVAEVYQNPDEGQMPRDKLLEHVRDAEAMFCLLRDKIDKELLDRAKNLKMIGTMSVGYEHIDVKECKARGIRIGYTPEVLTEATAELGVALLLATARRIPEAVQSAKTGGWTTWTPYYMCGKALLESTIGIYGMGTIGRNIAEKLLPFKPHRILYHNRTPIKDECESPFTYASFEDLLKESDFLIICATPTEENIGLFNKNVFANMKNDAILINVARGVLVNLNDLYEALKNKEIGAAGLDVTNPEPLPVDHPLFGLANCVILPHIGSATFGTRNLMVSTTEDNIYNFITGKPMTSELMF